MDQRRGSTDRRHEATQYEIRLKGHLDSSWADWLGGMSLTHASDGTTVVADWWPIRRPSMACSRSCATSA